MNVLASLMEIQKTSWLANFGADHFFFNLSSTQEKNIKDVFLQYDISNWG
jgi:hypothetical protein